MSMERIAAKCVNGNMMPAAELQWTEKTTNICLDLFFIMVIADTTVVDIEFIGKRMIFHQGAFKSLSLHEKFVLKLVCLFISMDGLKFECNFL